VLRPGIVELGDEVVLADEGVLGDAAATGAQRSS
jgi:hypothetical protein